MDNVLIRGAFVLDIAGLGLGLQYEAFFGM